LWNAGSVADGFEQDHRLERARTFYERAVYVGDPDAVDAAEKELDGVEADLLLSRGRLVHTRFLEQREAKEAIPEGDPTELEMFERARLLYHSLGDSRGEAEALLWIGLFHQVVAGYLEPSLELATLFDDKATMSEALRHLGIADHRAGRLDRAQDELEESVRLRRDIGLLSGVASNLIGLTYIAAAQGRRDDAQALIDEANDLAALGGARRIERHIEEARETLGLG
jgi:tetratricopeptide (TPR) repeat protein